LRDGLSCGIVGFGKGGEGPGTETTPTKLELNPAVRFTTQKGNAAMAKKKKKKSNKKAKT
jgi:hypothetical protein